MKVIVKSKVFRDDIHGVLRTGDVVDMQDAKAKFHIQRGELEVYETKVQRDRPSMGAGAPLSASPVAQVLPVQTLNPSESGAKRQRRTKEG